MSAFQAVNMSLAPDAHSRHASAADEPMPTTPRPTTAPSTIQQDPHRLDDAATPTRASFGALAGQKPLPESPFPAAVTMPDTKAAEQRPPSQSDSPTPSKPHTSEDIEMAESNDGGNSDQEDGSDTESVNADGKATKKKKSQRFWCTEYPPCNLSFTRSEHLARHIRKHTGERPFQCHCARRFSRLDNLRQHAQTVHVNEEIPTDSLAATGTRFQRQVRTERVPRTNTRARASTAGSQTPGRGHTRNALSASSISSIGSTFSQGPDIRRRPPPLVMASDPRNRLSMEGYAGSIDAASGQFPPYRPHSPGGFSTPTSATFSTGPNSPRWGSAMQSPMTSQSRTVNIFNGHRTPGRRLSVPSGANPFSSPHASSFGQPPLTPLNTNPSVLSPASSMVPSPTTSTSGSTWSRRESVSSSDEAWRRRTWHPETYNSFSSRLVNVSTPGNYYEQSTSHPAQQMQSGPTSQVAPPPQQQPAPAQTTRLPGIESFDPLRRPVTPPRRIPSPMMIDTPSRNPVQPSPGERYGPVEDRRTLPQWDMGLHRNLTRLEIANSTPPADSASAWASEANRAVQAQAEKARTGQPSVRFEQPSYVPQRDRQRPAYMGHHHTISAPAITTIPQDVKRQGWYNNAPVSPRLEALRSRTSPEDSSSSEGNAPGTPGSTSYTYSYNRSQNPPTEDRKMADNNMLRLETLVAVATSEDNATTAY